ncbi:hypothetical protein [Leptospira gomenensis]|nr:hypothetical protein [Leptospira gomenensis]
MSGREAVHIGSSVGTLTGLWKEGILYPGEMCFVSRSFMVGG